jgi:hypothetical protein
MAGWDVTTNPWIIARAVWPGAFLEPYQDMQIEAGCGDWPTVATCWRPPHAWRVWIRPLVLHPLPSLRWRYGGDAPTPHSPEGPATLRASGHNRRRREFTHKQVRELGYRYFVPVFPASAFGEKLPEVRDVITGRRYKPSIEALSKLVASGAVAEPPAATLGGIALAKHGRRLPLFGGGA